MSKPRLVTAMLFLEGKGKFILSLQLNVISISLGLKIKGILEL